MLNKLFGSKKAEYVVEFGDSKDAQAPQAESKPAPQAETESVKPAKAKAAKAKASPVAQPQTTAVAPPAPKPAPAKEPASINPGQVKTPAGMTFATDYLMPQPTTTRRGPGPSMAMFTDMASQMNRS
ncbi:conserved hypothetical protein [Planktothrix serta PCC 8927]|uniref:Uncharacterized protein n=1 Tax=Planktothrix serta PCC 8927 TaxID=671068 RepID=A0A7Z9E2W6_9CYAN|nr:hypothetical protein [Planktothrix serta]VXD22752.1 conserved hypothetical protein [Planktothrix serta PCC 8927]